MIIGLIHILHLKIEQNKGIKNHEVTIPIIKPLFGSKLKSKIYGVFF